MNLYWLTFFFCVFGVFSIDRQGKGRLSKYLLDKRTHQPLDVINGNKTSVTKYPFIASILYDGKFQGPAVILSDRWLVTTAFDVDYYNIFHDLAAFLFRVGTNIFYQGGQQLSAEKIILHPNYTGMTWDYDIALVKTKNKIKFNKKVQPIKLGTQEPKAGTKVGLIGWGQYEPVSSLSPHLREEQVTVFDWDKCKNIYTTNITTKFICTFDAHAGPCGGDCGDPLFINNTLYGLYAGDFDCVPGYYPILYTDVPSYYNWIKQTIKSDPDSSDLIL